MACVISVDTVWFGNNGQRKVLKTGAMRTVCTLLQKGWELRDIGGNDYHGDAGPVSVATPKANNNVLFHAMVEARLCKQAIHAPMT